MKSREPRKKVVVPARLSAGPRWVDAVILNISSRGLLVQSDTPPEVGTYVDIRRGNQVIIGRAMWSENGQFGVRTQDTIDLAALMGERSSADGRVGNGGGSGAQSDRRAQIRPTSGAVVQQLERSRAMASMLQFALIGLVALAAAAYAAMTVRDMLSRPAQAISSAMGGG